MNRVNRHVEENRERVRRERRGYHRKVIDNTKINPRRNVTHPVDPLIYDATAVWSTIARASHKDNHPFFFVSTISLSTYLPNNAKIAVINRYDDEIMTVAIMCVIFKKNM